MDGKRKILDAARKLYNEQGMKQVTARVICDALKISPGSFSYHFPDKSQIVKTLYLEMKAESAAVLEGLNMAQPGILLYLNTHQRLFIIQEKYRFFYLNLFEILNQNPTLKASYLEDVQRERQMGKQMFQAYVALGILKQDISEAQIDRMVDVGQILNSFWALDAEIMPAKSNSERMVHYIRICCGLIEPFLEGKELADYRLFFEELGKEGRL